MVLNKACSAIAIGRDRAHQKGVVRIGGGGQGSRFVRSAGGQGRGKMRRDGRVLGAMSNEFKDTTQDCPGTAWDGMPGWQAQVVEGAVDSIGVFIRAEVAPHALKRAL
eukprot:gene11300-36286_t